MKIALYSLPRSRSEVLFNYLEPLATMLDMKVFRPVNGNYYYIDNTKILDNTFLKIDSRTDQDLLIKIAKALSNHHWFITTRKFEDFCLSLSYAMQANKFHDTDTESVYNNFTISYEQYVYARDLYNKHINDIALLKQYINNITIIDYNDSIAINSNTLHIEKEYKQLCNNYIQFRDWQRVDYILNQPKIRKWNCWSSHHNKGSLHINDLFNDIVDQENCYMWYNIYENGDSQDWHTHDSVEKCGTRFLQIPNNSGLFEFDTGPVKNTQHTQIDFLPTDMHRVTQHNNIIPRITVSWNIKNK